ncbi:4'-phosphopantetheinyl transferase family protein [Streptomyces naphthomycinicus]|uniref:4'-phosphopantetheinyl transferase family protein n=1 Tax=Streptomyces naphthomycinicus TaxID=2872625 RepID=UPI001CEC7DFB|nr:4'-phosphopantetheinyl transferase superfamily protein [Streptomyces sp. TML10]
MRAGSEDTARTVTVVWGTAPRGERYAAHRALIHAAADATGGRAGTIRLRHRPDGRPFLTGPASGLQVSISHGRGVFAVALSGSTPVGVDVETVRPVPAEALARRWFDPAAAEAVARAPHTGRTETFFRLWTQKEAAGKAHGTGLLHGGLTRAVTPRPPGGPGGEPGPGPLSLGALPGSPHTRCGAVPVGLGRYILAVAVLVPPTDPVGVELRTTTERQPQGGRQWRPRASLPKNESGKAGHDA